LDIENCIDKRLVNLSLYL